MKKNYFISFFTISLLFLLSSCSFEKRLYNKGYAINWKKNSDTQKHQNGELQKENHTIAYKDFQFDIDSFLNLKVKENNELLMASNSKELMGSTIEHKVNQLKLNYNQNKYNSTEALPQKEEQKFEKFKTNLNKKLYRGGGGGDPSLAFGILSFIFPLIGLLVAGLPMSILAIIFGIIAIAMGSSHENTASIVLGAIGLALGIAELIIMLIYLSKI